VNTEEAEPVTQDDDIVVDDNIPKYQVELTTDEKGKRRAKVKLSANTTVLMRELGGGDFRLVRKLTGRDVQMITDNLALYSLLKINEEKLVPVANEMHLQSRSDKLSLQEYGQLPEAYDEAFNPTGDEKNG
jgi:hypothetical protein